MPCLSAILLSFALASASQGLRSTPSLCLLSLTSSGIPIIVQPDLKPPSPTLPALVIWSFQPLSDSNKDTSVLSNHTSPHNHQYFQTLLQPNQCCQQIYLPVPLVSKLHSYNLIAHRIYKYLEIYSRIFFRAPSIIINKFYPRGLLQIREICCSEKRTLPHLYFQPPPTPPLQLYNHQPTQL
ncbi:hypothetical protein K432DRAFT_99579 [Lepidopterella palustris CBS 459.81]|uniref:Uncharacterized protein n=1 Tax=Lepidopterella palustris CBS 459.81 TaxID=1314670 RepID=A0A8E2E6B3_9PEZI|nr:hypothetical protein K432DRAFT_99579 [Lepidopterella palustris CBS 459.81]